MSGRHPHRHSDLWQCIEPVTDALGYIAAIEERWGKFWVNVGETVERDYVVTDLRSSLYSYGPYQNLDAARQALPEIQTALESAFQ